MATAQGQPERPWHAVTWLVWALAGAASLQLAPSPVYAGLVVAIATLVVAVHGLDGPFARAFPTLLALAFVFAGLRVALAALTTHGGPDVLATLPALTLPDWLGGFTVGGSLESPVIAQAAAEGLVIVGVIAVFGAFNAVVSHYELLEQAPRAFHELGLVVVVALAFVPSTIAAVHAVREADRARTGGRVVRRGRLLRQLVPILDSGLERAVHLAESMDSRGFAHGGAGRRDRVAAWAGLAGLLGLAGAFVALIGRADVVAALLGGAGALALVLAVRLASGSSGRTRYRPRAVTGADWAVAAAVLVAPAALAVLAAAGDDSLSWAASPLSWPALHVLPVLALGALLAPMARRPAPRPVASPVPDDLDLRAVP